MAEISKYAPKPEPRVDASMAALEQLTSNWSPHLEFFVNGSKISLDASSVDPRATLLDWIRSQHGLTGTKLGCSEG
jgi:xanthine dehydrogenase/oxidase